MQDIFAQLQWRGLIHQTTDPNLGDWLRQRPRTVYAGFDPTADSLHVGHLVALMTLRRFQKAGHRPIVVIGGATGMIGDPSGKTEERQLLSWETLQANIAGMEPQLRRFLDFESGPSSALLVNNYDWIGPIRFLDFLRDVGKHVPVSVMLTKESVKTRLERPEGGLSYTEFSYMLLQAYDFVYLYKKYGCELQIGGSDQWGNITAGIDLARRLCGVQLYGLTCPLLTRSDGTKMGKTETGAVWLSPQRTSPYQFYQYWINLPDADVATCLRFFTELDAAEIQAAMADHQKDPSRREAQKLLARELTRLVHGPEALAAAQRASEILFGAEIEHLTDTELEAIFADVPSRTLPKSRLLNQGLWIVEALCEAGLAKTRSEARRLISQGGVYLNNRRVEDMELRLGPEHLASQTILVLRTGKKNYALLRFGE
ncbi:MAG: tyrosine--tRNA ligase [Thermoguttaceae bacterium]|nr:tyrosine--tRNA ligase [Thermoguttaceae bacterium]MDW8037948.1 tyrosine--tRNA ligase [Thermoguttaceae bacterium]